MTLTVIMISCRKCLILFNWLPPLTSILDQHQQESYVSGSKKGKRKPLLHTFLHAPPPVLLEFVNGLADDAATFSRLGILGKRSGEQAARLADWCWFAITLVNLVENSVERSVILDLQHTGAFDSFITVQLWAAARTITDHAAGAVESRLYAESMSGTTAKSNPSANKLDEKELGRLQRQDYWIQVTRLKLLMDLIFVCECYIFEHDVGVYSLPRHSIRRVRVEARQRPSPNIRRSCIGHSQVCPIISITRKLRSF